MSALQRALPDDVLLEHACRGLLVYGSNPIVEAAAELGELHAARFAARRPHGIEAHRLRLARRVDVLVVAIAPVPNVDARLHPESVGAVVDRFASLCAIAFRAPRARVTSAEIDDARAQLGCVRADYVELIDQVSAGTCCLPNTHLPRDTYSGLRLMMRRHR